MDHATDTDFTVEVVYALPHKAIVRKLKMVSGDTVSEAIEQSGLLKQCPEIDLHVNEVGIFGVRCELDRLLKDGDRVEIYRALLIDPKEARRRRAAKKNKQE